MTNANDAFQRLESLLEGWAEEVTTTHQELSQRVDSFKSRLEETPARADELEQIAATLAASKSQFTSLQETLRQCADASRQAVDRIDKIEATIESLDEDVRGLKNMAIHANGEQASFDGLEPPALLDTLNELRTSLEEQRSQIARLDERIASLGNGGGAGPTQQRFSRLERDLARLRGEMHRLRAGGSGKAPRTTAFAEVAEESVPDDSPTLNISGFDDAGRRRRMGEILVDAGVLTPDQLERALAIQQEQPQRRLGAILMELGYTESDEVAQVLASQARVPFVRLDRDEPDPAAVKLVSERLATHHVCIPIRVEDDRIVLAMANPMDLIAIEDIEHATGRGVDANAASADAILQAIKAYYGGELG